MYSRKRKKGKIESRKKAKKNRKKREIFLELAEAHVRHNLGVEDLFLIGD